jgi:hypothetical protein
MDLLSGAQRTEITLALQDVFDTFCKTPITYNHATLYADDFMEGTGNTQIATFQLSGFVEYMDDRAKETLEGDYYRADVAILFGLSDLQSAGCINGQDVPIFVPFKDKMVINGESFTVSAVHPEGAFSKRNEAVKVFGYRDVKPT